MEARASHADLRPRVRARAVLGAQEAVVDIVREGDVRVATRPLAEIIPLLINEGLKPQHRVPDAHDQAGPRELASQVLQVRRFDVVRALAAAEGLLRAVGVPPVLPGPVPVGVEDGAADGRAHVRPARHGRHGGQGPAHGRGAALREAGDEEVEDGAVPVGAPRAELPVAPPVREPAVVDVRRGAFPSPFREASVVGPGRVCG